MSTCAMLRPAAAGCVGAAVSRSSVYLHHGVLCGVLCGVLRGVLVVYSVGYSVGYWWGTGGVLVGYSVGYWWGTL